MGKRVFASYIRNIEKAWCERRLSFLEGVGWKKIYELQKWLSMQIKKSKHSIRTLIMKTLSSNEIREQFTKNKIEWLKAAKRNQRWDGFPPSGVFGLKSWTIADEFPWERLMWTVDTIELERPEPGCIYCREYEKNNTQVLIVLMHLLRQRAESIRYND